MTLIAFHDPSRHRKGFLEGSFLSGHAVYSCLVSGSFNPPSGVLFSFPSRYFFAIGFGTYLALEANDPHLPASYSAYSTLERLLPHLDYVYGAITLYGGAFQPTSTSQAWGKMKPSKTSHHPYLIGKGFNLGCAVFSRRYSRHLI